MKHDWEMQPATLANVTKYGWEPRRRCRNCGKTQQKVAITAWMKVTGYQWYPLVGRCKPKPKMRRRCTRTKASETSGA